MSGSDTECDGNSSDGMTPIMPIHANYDDDSPKYYSYRDSLSQLDAMLPPKSSGASVDQLRVSDVTGGIVQAYKRPSILVPVKATGSVKAVVRPPLSEAALKVEAIRIMKSLPRGEATMWSLMHNVEYNDMRLLCKYKGLKFSGRASKAEMGQIILNSMQKGGFESISTTVGGNVNRTKRSPNSSESLETNLQSKDLEKAGISDQKTVPTHSHRNNGSTPVPVMALGSNDTWKQVDNWLRKLLDEQQDMAKEEGGIFVNSSEWQPCPKDLEAILEADNPTWMTRQMIRMLEKNTHLGFRRLRYFREKRKEGFIGNDEADQRNGISDVGGIESDLESSDGHGSINRGLNTAERGLRTCGRHFGGENNDNNEDILFSSSSGRNEDNYFQRYYDSVRSQNEKRNDIFYEEPSSSRSSDGEFKIYHFHEKSLDNESDKLNSPIVNTEKKRIVTREKKNIAEKSTVEFSEKMGRIESDSLQQYLDNRYNSEDENQDMCHEYQKEKNNDNNYKKIKINETKNNNLSMQIIEIKKYQIFPDLQEHLIRRYSHPHNAHATQTDPIENYFPMNERKNEIASNFGVKNTVGGSDFHTSNPSFVAVKVIRFDNQKLGLIFSKREVGLVRELAIIQSKVISLLAEAIDCVLVTGDILVAINGNTIKNLRFADQIEIIKNSRRPINLSFIPDRKK